jgi:hypothetical protein
MTIREMIETLKKETGIEDIEDYEFGIDVNAGEYWSSYYRTEAERYFDTKAQKCVYITDDNGHRIEHDSLNRYEINKEYKFITFFD